MFCSLPLSHKQEELPNRQLWTCFCYDICQENEVCANLSYCVLIQSLVVQHTVAQICLTVYRALKTPACCGVEILYDQV
jgi:hypothetical protein